MQIPADGPRRRSGWHCKTLRASNSFGYLGSPARGFWDDGPGYTITMITRRPGHNVYLYTYAYTTTDITIWRSIFSCRLFLSISVSLLLCFPVFPACLLLCCILFCFYLSAFLLLLSCFGLPFLPNELQTTPKKN